MADTPLDHFADDDQPFNMDFLDAFDDIDRNIRNLNQKHLRSPPLSVASTTSINKPSDDHNDEEAAVAFLCSVLPHYEGPTPIFYDNLDTALDAYVLAKETEYDDVPEEEFVEDAAWECTEEGGEDGALERYEGWIDFEGAMEIAQRVLPVDDYTCVIGARSETDYMLVYEIISDTTTEPLWILQVPRPGVPATVFESEILTVTYVEQNSGLPVSTVWAYDFDPANSIGVPYAIMSKLPGISLTTLWQSMDALQKRMALGQIADVVVQLSQLQFPAIGSLKLEEGTPTIGPVLDPRQIEDGYSELDGEMRYGPFETTSEFYRAMVSASAEALQILNPCQSGLSLDQIELAEYLGMVEKFACPKYNAGPFAVSLNSFDRHHFLFDPASYRLTGIVDWTFSYIKPLPTLLQAPSFAFDDTPRWEPALLEPRNAYRRNLVRYRQWFKAGVQKSAWALLGKDVSEEFAELVNCGYWRYKFETEIMEHVRYSNPWSFRAIWEHMNKGEDFAMWFASLRADDEEE
ncbi:hypothetical protein FBU59_000623 [Linderina macrospora]|uniref:Uncharacterized protein n=1 Tax=Linderina macrospora TaxID=4868 RepID=A0ACC1JGB9_9FUNG|nr:hypothetical protein FBU59_000623 [Linderina macrospora]